MYRIQPIALTASGSDILARFKRLRDGHDQCWVGEFERPNGEVEYPYYFKTDESGERSGPHNHPKEYFWDVYRDGTGELWLVRAALHFDHARQETLQLSDPPGQWVPLSLSVQQQDTEGTGSYRVIFECDNEKLERDFRVSGTQPEHTVSWMYGSCRAQLNNIFWDLVDPAPESKELMSSVVNFHAARSTTRLDGPQDEEETA